MLGLALLTLWRIRRAKNRYGLWYDCKRFYVKKLGDRKRPRSFLNVACIYAGNYLLSHTLSRAVPSAQRGLTSVFGMGTGGTPAVRSPTTWSRQPSAVSRQQTLLWRLIPPMRGKLVKDPEDEASQLNRLGETRQAASLLQSVFVGAQSSVLCLQNCVQVLTLLRRPSAFEQFRTESLRLSADGCFSAPSKFYGQAERAISTGKLHALLRFNILPINQVVYLGPSLPLRVGRSHLEECFPLICIQRLSQPNFATQRCHWHDSWITRGSSIPVLSY
jgi:hypothetical protein